MPERRFEKPSKGYAKHRREQKALRRQNPTIHIPELPLEDPWEEIKRILTAKVTTNPERINDPIVLAFWQARIDMRELSTNPKLDQEQIHEPLAGFLDKYKDREQRACYRDIFEIITNRTIPQFKK